MSSLAFFFLSVKFHLESQDPQSLERMVMKCANLVEEDNPNSDDDDNQDSKEREQAEHVFRRSFLF